MSNRKNKNKKNGTETRNSATSARQKNDKRMVREINRDLSRASKTGFGGPNPRVQTKGQRTVVKKAMARIHPESAMGAWVASLARPFEVYGVFCPVNYNPAPSFIQSISRTTSTNLSFAGVAGLPMQMVLYPGHNAPIGANVMTPNNSQMDAVSYHSNDQYVGGSALANHYVVGPMAKQDSINLCTPIGGVITAVSTASQCFGATNTAVSTPILWDNPLPYLSNSTVGGHHSRWQLVSMGIRIHNITPELTRGGSIVSVQPNNSVKMLAGLQPQSFYEIFPTFHDWGVGDGRGVEISWIPRAQDLAFWHGAENIVSGAPYTSVDTPGIIIWLNSPAANAQTYSYEIVANWQLSGNYLNSVGGPGAHYPELKPAVEKMTSVLLNNSPTAAPAPRVAESVSSDHGTATPWSATEWAFEKAKDFAGHALHNALRGHAQMPHQRIR